MAEPLLALSFLGTGNYEETTYALDGRACTTRFFTAAVARLFEPARLLVVMTPQAEERHGAALAAQCAFEPVRVPSGADERELWQLFDRLAAVVPERARLVIDVTHGFRTQPMLALAAAVYLRAARDAEVERIVYGAYEARNAENHSPVFDLTAFVDLIDWSTATRQFVERGDARPLRDLLRSLDRHARRTGLDGVRLRSAGNRLALLTTALSLNRPKDVVEQAATLPAMLEELRAGADGLAQAEPLRLLLQRVAERFEGLAAAGGEVFTPEGFAAQGAMVRFYLATDQIVQGFMVAGEALVSKRCIMQELDPTREHNREAAQKSLNQLKSLLDRGQVKPHTADGQLGGIWGDLKWLRNQLAHAGMIRPATPLHQIDERAPAILLRAARYLEEG